MAVFFRETSTPDAASHRETGGLTNRGDSWTGDARQRASHTAGVARRQPMRASRAGGALRSPEVPVDVFQADIGSAPTRPPTQHWRAASLFRTRSTVGAAKNVVAGMAWSASATRRGPTSRASETRNPRAGRATQSRRDEGRLARRARISLRNAPSSALTARSVLGHGGIILGRYSTVSVKYHLRMPARGLPRAIRRLHFAGWAANSDQPSRSSGTGRGAVRGRACSQTPVASPSGRTGQIRSRSMVAGGTHFGLALGRLLGL